MAAKSLKNIYSKGTLKKPALYFDSIKGIIQVSGRSTPENCDELYKPLIKWIKQYVKNPQPNTKVIFDYEYFNSSTAKMLIHIFKALREITFSNNNTIKINWIYEDEDIFEYGRDFSDISKIPFNFINKNTNSDNDKIDWDEFLT